MQVTNKHHSRFNIHGVITTPDGCETFTSRSSKTTAEIQFARVEHEWIAEYRFRFRCGAFHGRTLPLSVYSNTSTDRQVSLTDAALRLLDHAALRCGDEASLNATQRNELSELRGWLNALIEKLTKPMTGMRFLDVYAGIGGFHQALSGMGATCVGAVEIDKAARETYAKNHGTGFPFHDDICKVDPKALPDFDILCGGFPCQSFSNAGNGEGYAAAGKGGLFFELVRIVAVKKPKQIILENVAAFATHDGGATCDLALDAFAEIGYDASVQVLNAADFGLPQKRERLFIVAIRLDLLDTAGAPFLFPQATDSSKVVEDILEARITAGRCATKMNRKQPDLTERIERTVTVGLINDKESQGYRVYSPKGKGITLCANSGGPGMQTGLYLVAGKPRKLTPRECARMQGFPDTFQHHPSPFLARKQFGNAVAVPVVAAIARESSQFLTGQSAH